MTGALDLDTRLLRDALGAFATGVTIVTTRDESGCDIGLTANSFNSVSLDPPMVLWSLAKTSQNWEAFKKAKHFAVHVLGADQEWLSNQFAKRGADRFLGVPVERGFGEAPLLPDCAARFQCRTAFTYEGGDHEIFVGEVLGFDDFKRPPLVFQRGKYAFAIKKPAVRNPDDASDIGANFTKDYLGTLLAIAHHQQRAQLRPALESRGLDEEDYAILSLLIVADHRDAAEVDAVLQAAGKRLHESKLQKMAESNLIVVQSEERAGTRLSLTEHGRLTIIELMAAAKAAEADAEMGLEFGESQILKHLLKRVIRSTNSGPLRIWRGRGEST